MHNMKIPQPAMNLKQVGGAYPFLKEKKVAKLTM